MNNQENNKPRHRHTEIQQQETEAINYINEQVIEKQQKHEEFQVEGLWQEVILNFLKKQALVFCGQAITHLKNQAIEWTVDLSHWLLTNLEDYLVSQYERANQEEKELFLSKIKKNFPNSELLKKLEK